MLSFSASKPSPGTLSPPFMRALKTEILLRGEKLTADLVAEAAAVAGAEARPISDQRASAEFRRELVRVLTGRMVEAARADAGRSRARGRRA